MPERVGPPMTTAGRKKRVKMVEDAADALEVVEAQALHLSAQAAGAVREIQRIREQLLVSMAPPPEEKPASALEPEPASG